MKRIFLVGCLAFALASCNNETKDTKETPMAKDTATAMVELPYKLDKPYRNWQMGSTENAAAAMKALKSYVDKDFAGLSALISDSLEVAFDHYQSKMGHDSAVKFFTDVRKESGDIAVTMYDYESVVSADKQEEWVTLWYKQVWTDNAGKKDSLSIIDDCKMKDGKIATLDEKIQHYQAKK
ncbi:hypothetical protein BH11BAC3_BH11BAC3_22210 [soil metagenome]